MAATLPKAMVIKSNYFSKKGYFHYKADGSVALGEESVFSTLAKVQVEPATSNNRYVHFRFSYSNKYWHRKADGSWFIAAESSNPEEDTTKPSCTLFEPIKVENDLFYLIHVQSGGRLLIDNATMVFYVEFKPRSYQGYLSGVDWDTLVKLPAHVAFKGDNNKYLKAFSDIYNNLQFSSEDANDVLSAHTVSLTPDGHVRISSDHFGKMWKRGPDDWILADSTDESHVDNDTLFWPVKIDVNAVVLQNAGNRKFCRRLSDGEMSECLNSAGESSQMKEARLQVEELVNGRKILKVRYMMEYAQICDEEPYSDMIEIVNNGDEDASMAVTIKHHDSKSFTFGRSSWLTAAPGVATTIEAALPFIEKQESINNINVAVSNYEISAPLQWNKTTTITKSIRVTGSFEVPARSKAFVKYVGTRGTCKVPFSYTQQDTSSVDGGITETGHDDGVYTGVNCYDFKFVVERTEPL